MCLTPEKLKSGDTVPCGKCAECITYYRQGWITRILLEAARHTYCWFITLTYSDENLVYGEDDYPVLNFSDVQKYLKKLRKSDLKFKYFIVGEYGEKTKRPHFHFIYLSHNEPNYDVISQKWELGHTHILNGGEGQIIYMTKDMMKFKGRTDRFKAIFRNSKGFGETYALENKKWHKNDLLQRTDVHIFGERHLMPRYLKQKIYTKHERNVIYRSACSRRANNDFYGANDTETQKKQSAKARTSVIDNEYKLRCALKVTHLNKKL